MELALNELKIQAKKRLKLLKSDTDSFTHEKILKQIGVNHQNDVQLKHALTIVSRQLGFSTWQQTSSVLSGARQTNPVNDMGTLFYPKAGHGLTNEWFADYASAYAVLMADYDNKWLFPYKNQFIVGDANYLAAFRFEPEIILLLEDINHDMEASYNTPLWDQITCAMLKKRAPVYFRL